LENTRIQAFNKAEICNHRNRKEHRRFETKASRLFLNQTDKHGDFLRKLTYYVSSYVSLRIPEIADELYKIDDAMRAGFRWELGPFEQWDVVGVEKIATGLKEAGFKLAPWVDEMLAAGNTTFYKVENGVRKYYDIPTKSYKTIPGRESFIILSDLQSSKNQSGKMQPAALMIWAMAF
jgi:3-hydroxyacyl-CoA dehydrogenase